MPVLDNLFNTYSRMGDLASLAILAVVFILLAVSYVVRDKSYRIFASIVGLAFLAAIISIAFNELLLHPELLSKNGYLRGIAYLLRVIYHTFLFMMLFSFALYATIVSKMKKKRARTIAIIGTVLFALCVAVDVILTFQNIGFIIKPDGTVEGGSNVFMVGYVLFVAFLAVLLFRIRKLIYKRVLWGFYATMALAVIIRFAQLFFHDASLTTLTFVLPVMTMLYIMHLNPYNISTGTLDAKALEDMVKNLYDKKKSFIIMSMLLPDFVGEGKTFPEEVKNQTRRFTVEYFRNGTLFQVGNGQTIMIARKDSNPDYNQWMQTILHAFQEQYRIHQLPYKIVYGESFEEDIAHNQYISLINNIHDSIPNNTMHRIDKNDISLFKEHQYILEQLTDIYKKCDLDDPRVLVYAQPVYNIQTKRFDTAEALMRLNLDEKGIVSPCVFIPIAESRGYIHVLTKIILNKTCRIIHQLTEDNIPFKRISVNVSISELKDKWFCDDVNFIIHKNQVSGDKLAIELTESQSEEDFLVMKERIEKLHEEGIQFYLDDFGTGYSNMERILELPFDIIKFDRSMVIASGQDSRSEHIVEKLAKMFADFNYFVLYEGIEDSADENRCLSMSATYLQGFKYSRPIPIADLHTFLSKSE